MDNKEILAFNDDVVRCIDCMYCGSNGTICRYGVGKHTKPDDFCSNGIAEVVDEQE